MTYTFSTEWFAQCLRKWIDNRPLRHVAEDTGVSYPSLSRYCNGGTPNVQHFLALCVHMNADPLDFCFNEDKEWD